MNELIKEKYNSIAKATFRIAKAYPKSFYCSNLSLILQKAYEAIVIFNTKLENQFSFEYISELIDTALKEIEYIEKEGIVAPINMIVLRKNINHAYFLARVYFKEINEKMNKTKEEILGVQHKVRSNEVDLQGKHAESIKEQSAVTGEISHRQNAILALFLESQNKAIQLKDIMLRFPDISDRTIRFDLAHLVRIGKIEQKGFGRGSFYSKQV